MSMTTPYDSMFVGYLLSAVFGEDLKADVSYDTLDAIKLNFVDGKFGGKKMEKIMLCSFFLI